MKFDTSKSSDLIILLFIISIFFYLGVCLGIKKPIPNKCFWEVHNPYGENVQVVETKVRDKVYRLAVFKCECAIITNSIICKKGKTK